MNYPFGFGKSYTTFNLKTLNVNANRRTVSVTVKIKNTGRYPGKEVAEVYFSAPQRGLDKPYQALGGYAKTDLLKPGESQKLTIRYATTQMASYNDAKAANVMDAGDYLIRVGNSSRNTAVEAKLRLNRKVVTEKRSTQFDDQSVDNELTAQPSNFYSYPNETRQIRNAGTATACRRPVPHHQPGLRHRPDRFRSTLRRATTRWTVPSCRPPPPTPPEPRTGKTPGRPTRPRPGKR